MPYSMPLLKRTVSICLCVLLVAGMWAELRAQHYPMLHYTIKNGLASNTIYDIYRDKKGYFWLGTDKGISRFNGISFENFTTADGLSDNECFFFRPDPYGRLWIGTYNGHLCFYKDGVFHNEKNTPWLKLPFTASHTYEIAVNPDSTLTIFFRDDSRIIEIKNQSVRVLESEITRRKHHEIYHFLYARKISHERYLLLYRREAAIINFSTNSIEKEVHIEPEIKNVIFKHDELLLLRNGGILSTIDNTGQVHNLQRCQLPQSATLYQRLFSGTDTFFISNSGVIGNHNQNFEEVPSAFSAAINKSLMLIGTSSNGLFLFDLSRKIRNKLNPKPEGNVDHAQIANNKLLVLNKRKSLSIYDLKSLHQIRNTSVSHYHQIVPTLNFVRNNYFYSLSRDTNYRILLSDQPKSPETIYDLDFNTTITQYIDHDTELVAKLPRKICRIDVRDLEYRRTIRPITNFGIGADPESIFGFAADSHDRIWFSTVKQVYKVVGDTGISQKQFAKLAFREIVFSGKHLVGITQNNRLVVCHNYDSKNIRVDTLGESDCVWNKLIKINDSTVFITTNNYPRLLQFFSQNNKSSFRLRTLDNPFIPYQPDYLTQTDSGLMMFAEGEMFLFPSEYLSEDKPRPSVHLSYLLSGSRKIPLTDTVSLAFSEAQNLKILFQPISFFNTTLSYEYRISSEKKSGKWIAIQGEELNLIKLFFGSHLIDIRAKTLSGEYSATTSILLNVDKPWWATWWFILICFAILILLVSALARRNIQRKLRKRSTKYAS